jgi:choline kinase
LRIYGPQVDHLIDREKELQILRRLGKKNIGPRILGTFLNGRFEEYFEARPLTHKELRMPETAKQVAKRMRELHDGITLLEEEREGGPMIFNNWDKWVDRCEQVTTWLDKELESPQNEVKAATEPWRRRGYVCGVKWDVFRKAVENYRRWLVASSGGIAEIKRQLVFAHNDVGDVFFGLPWYFIDFDSRRNMAIYFAWSQPHNHPYFYPQMNTNSSSLSILSILPPTHLALSLPTTL